MMNEAFLPSGKQYPGNFSSPNAKGSAPPRFMAHFFSYLFHPLFIPLYAVLFLVYIHPSYFAGYSARNKSWLPVRTAYSTILLPLITVLLLKQLGFISSLFLKTQKDRIIPYIASGIYFFWLYLVFKNDPNLPLIMSGFMMGVFLSSSVALIANIYLKISMHAIGMGGLTGLFLVVMQQNNMLMTIPLSIAILITGLVCTSRMIVSDHRPKEIYLGLLAGLICQFISAFILL